MTVSTPMRNPTHRTRLVVPLIFDGGGDEQRNWWQSRWRARQLGRYIEGFVRRGQISRERRPVWQWLFRRELAEHNWKSVRRWARQRCASRKSLTNCSSRVAHPHSQSAKIFLWKFSAAHSEVCECGLQIEKHPPCRAVYILLPVTRCGRATGRTSTAAVAGQPVLWDSLEIPDRVAKLAP